MARSSDRLRAFPFPRKGPGLLRVATPGAPRGPEVRGSEALAEGFRRHRPAQDRLIWLRKETQQPRRAAGIEGTVPSIQKMKISGIRGIGRSWGFFFFLRWAKEGWRHHRNRRMDADLHQIGNCDGLCDPRTGFADFWGRPSWHRRVSGRAGGPPPEKNGFGPGGRACRRPGRKTTPVHPLRDAAQAEARSCPAGKPL